MYTSMAHYVAKVLHLRPNDILDGWGVPELLVAFGEYANETADKNFKEWAAIDPKYRKGKAPSRCIVQFLEPEDNDG